MNKLEILVCGLGVKGLTYDMACNGSYILERKYKAYTPVYDVMGRF